MSVHRLKDGRRFAVWRESCRQLRRYFGHGPEGESKARELDAGRSRPWTRRTPDINSALFADLVSAYIAAKSGSMQRASVRNFEWKMLGVILPEIGHLKAAKLTPERLDLYISKRLKTPRILQDGSKRYPKRTTIHREISDIKAVLNWAVKRRYIAFNPAAGLEMPKRDDAILMPPSAEEVQSLVNAAPDHLKRGILLSYYLGLRPGARELFALTWQDVDGDTVLVRSASKGGPRLRMVPIHPGLAPLLKSWRSADGNAGPLIHYQGEAVASLKRSWRTAKARAGIKRRLPMYGLRHAFASILLAAAADLKSVSEILGHSRPDTTTRIYQHTDRAMHVSAIAKLPELAVNVETLTGIKAEKRKD
jgi:integrase